jgi:hypothetical protein
MHKDILDSDKECPGSYLLDLKKHHFIIGLAAFLTTNKSLARINRWCWCPAQSPFLAGAPSSQLL